VLSPTTILAAQHYSTFSDRMCDFPVKLAAMSRFVKPAVQKENIRNIRDGKVDIIIGTHRLLSEDIEFKNIGLLIVDEEQRFGVKHKERIKQISYQLDVLSLTATPIPRTLQMSLIGARDLSIINTPPQNRLPIKTIVCPYHDEQVKSAIEDELDRGGQVYFVNNRIQPLDLIKDTIEQLVPKARVIIAHGQMDEELLETIMKEFVAGRYDVLLSTVIIENGLDIPNVNTIIVNRADTMGLSQLYQLRGRVGRSSEQAFAYFFTPPFRELNDIALKRLKALEQYTELGSGFQIAMRDLEIRGAGNILGTRQHGFIEAVGFEMYCRILQEAIDEIKGNQPAPKPLDINLEIPLEAYIPNEYIPDGTTRVSVYQELSSLSSLESIGTFEQSLLDRFGPLPQPVVSLIIILKIKVLAGSLRINKIVITKKGNACFYFSGTDQQLQKYIAGFIIEKNYLFQIDNSVPVNIHFQLHASTLQLQCLETIELLKKVAITGASPASR
jgi:transcription-repair coupling factor (superfamily II helicase)